MVGSSKILTVSYGTFSCTLEGFDDSFETMKAIAEYFRDLASDDRYFGAEPPTPDADMLARIAEREIARRVEAHEHEGRIVLRAQDTATTGKALAVAPSAAPGPAPAPKAKAAPEQSPSPEAQDAPEAEGAPKESAAPEADATPEDAPAPEMDATPEPADDAGAPAMADAPDAPDVQDDSEDAVTLAALEPEGIEHEYGEAVPETTIEDAASPLVQQADETAPLPPVAEADDLSARLDLIRSVVGASDSYDEDEHAQDFADAVGASPIAWDEDDAGGDDATMPAGGTADATLPESEDEAPAALDDDGDAAPAAPEDSLFEDTLAALLADATPVQAQATETTETTETTDAANDIDDNDRRGARVLKVSRADVDTARAEGVLDTEGEAGEAGEAGEVGEDTVNIFSDETDALSPEDEEDLQRELASLDAELGDGIGSEDEAGQGDAPEETAERSARAPEQAVAAAEPGKRTEVSRIFDETDNQMADPGSVRRRNTIQHLRAALAATRAEKAAGAKLEKKVDATPYRGDLDATVRPRRAITPPESPRSARPEEAPLAPLKLVAEQRVDTQRSKVRPRRVTTARAEVVDAPDKGFSAFAEELGATALPDLLEAAAAFLADVEGRSQFSRPMLMGKLREIDEDGFSREDELRSFGQLLREGKLQKLSGGRFCVTEETEFRAAAQRRAS